RPQVVFIHHCRFLVTRRLEARLGLEALTLVNRIVEFAEGVGEFPPAREELESLRQRGIATFGLGQRRQLQWVVQDERWPVNLRLYMGLEQLVEELRTAEPSDTLHARPGGGTLQRDVVQLQDVRYAQRGAQRRRPRDA